MIDNSKNELLKLAYEDGDIKFYCHHNPLEISPIRGVAAERASRFVNMMITEKNLRDLIKEIKTEAGKGDLVKAFSIVQEIEYRLDFICEENSVLELACIYYMLQDENPETFNSAFTEKKMKIFNENEKAKNFFLLIGLSLTEQFSKLPEEDLSTSLQKKMEYLKEMQIYAERIFRYIPRTV